MLRKTNLFGRLGSKYRQAKKIWYDVTLSPRKLSSMMMADELESLAEHLEHIASFTNHPELKDRLGVEFKGVDTNFEILLRGAEFLNRAYRMTAGYGDIPTKLRNLVTFGDLNELERLSGLSETETLSVLHQALDKLSEKKEVGISDLVRNAEEYFKAICNLAGAAIKFEFNPSLSLHSLAQLAEDLSDLERVHVQIQAHSEVDKLIRALGLDPGSDAKVIETTIAFADALTGAIAEESSELMTFLFAEPVEEHLSSFKSLGALISSGVQSERAARQVVFGLAGTLDELLGGEPSQSNLPDLRTRVDAALESANTLPVWIKFVRAKKEVIDERVWPVVEAFGEDAPVNLPEAFSRVFWRSLAKKAFEQNPNLKTVSGMSQQRVREQFRRTDQRVTELNRQELAANLSRLDPPLGIDTGPRNEWTELALVRHQTQLQRPRIAIRDLVRRAGQTVQTLKPCWMMSPISVAQFLEPNSLRTPLTDRDKEVLSV